MLNRTPKYIMVEVKKAVEVMQMPLMGLSTKPAFDDWDPTAYSHMLSFFTGYTVEKLKPDDSGRVMSFISDAEGKPFNIPLKYAQPSVGDELASGASDHRNT